MLMILLYCTTGFLVLFGPGSSLQVSIGLLLSLLYVNLYLNFKPFNMEPLQRVKLITLWQLYFVFFFAFIIKAEFINPENKFVVISFIFLIFASVVRNIAIFVKSEAEQNQSVRRFRQTVDNRLRLLSGSGRSIEMDKLYDESQLSDAQVESQLREYMHDSQLHDVQANVGTSGLSDEVHLRDEGSNIF